MQAPQSLSAMQRGNMSTAAAPSPAKMTRKPSLKEQPSYLKEQPSYLKEVSVALSRREELLQLRQRMSAARLIMDADPAAKPWLLSRSISNKDILITTRARD